MDDSDDRRGQTAMHRLSRRDVLATAGIGALTALAGCAGGDTETTTTDAETAVSTSTTSSREMGEVTDYDMEYDWAAIDDSGSLNYSADIMENEDQDRVELEGTYENYSFLASESAYVRKTGITTNLTAGQLDEYYETRNSSCSPLTGHGLAYDSFITAPGDSGAPHWVYKDWDMSKNALLVGMHVAGRGGTAGTSDCSNVDESEGAWAVSSERLSYDFDFSA